MKEIPYNENHPHYFFRETWGKWVRYNNQWFTPEEWTQYSSKHAISPKVEWYFDILEVMSNAEEKIVNNPSPERLKRYFSMVSRILDYYHYKMQVHGWQPGMGR